MCMVEWGGSSRKEEEGRREWGGRWSEERGGRGEERVGGRWSEEARGVVTINAQEEGRTR